MNNKTFLLLAVGLATGFSSLQAQDKLYNNTFSLSQVTLLDGPFKHAQDLNVEHLLQYDVDRLLQPFLKEAGLEPKGPAFPNWAGLDGHVGGHYLSALAIHYASTGNQECKERMEYMLSELKRAQDANGNGYVGGVPDSKRVFSQAKEGNIQAIHNLWVPLYNIHKIYAGLRDAWMYGDSELAKEMFLKLCDWGIEEFNGYSDQQMERLLSQEHGGFNEVFVDAYAITKDKKYLDFAARLTHHELFDSMLKGVDNLSNKHANTQVPKVVGYARVAEMSEGQQQTDYFKASDFFWDRVANYRSIAFGGNSRREHFPAESDYVSYTEEREGPESCNTNNMLKLTENLFRMEQRVEYVDFFENATFNHILSTQHPEHGGYVYFTPARPSHYRVYSQPNEGMWCCVGTGMENHGKYGEFIYTHNENGLYINLFIASKLDWKEKKFSLEQNTQFPSEEGSVITITSRKATKMKLLVRYPGWVKEGEMEVVVDGINYAADCKPGSYVEIERKWKNGDCINIKTPMHFTTEKIAGVDNYIAIKRGPILLGVKTNTRDMNGLVAGDGRWAHIASGPLQSAVEDAPYIVASETELMKALENAKVIEGEPFHYSVSNLFKGAFATAELEPFYGIHDSRYSIYYLCMTAQQYNDYVAELKAKEEALLALDARTIDGLQTGEQQPEVDHRMQQQGSEKGNYQGEAYRDARGGWFQYELETGGRTDLTLMLRYWGNETGGRTFSILVDGVQIAVENTAHKWDKSEFFNVEYAIPQNLLKDKKIITVRFQADSPRNTVGGIYKVRLLKP